VVFAVSGNGRGRMGSFGRYTFRITFGAFLLVCISLTTLMWITQALRDVDLLTNQGQSFFIFVGITGLIIPFLLTIIAPLALTVAVAYVLNKLSNDSELIVMNAAGMPPRMLFRPFLMAGVVVSLIVAALSLYVSPWSLRELRRWASEARADFVTNIVQPGRFSKFGDKLTLHIRQREPNGQLLGIFIDDQRDPKDRSTLLAERGNIVKTDRSIFLVMENGSAQRHEAGKRDPTIVLFDSYAFDLSAMMPGERNIKYTTRERYLWELLNPTPSDPQFNDAPAQVRSELHDRITAILYPLAFVFVTFAYLGAPRTTRQSRATSMIAAVGVILALRGLGFAAVVSGTHTPSLLVLPYIALAAAFALGYFGIMRGIIIEPPAVVVNAISTIVERISQRLGDAGGMIRQAP
jgi:lipopolysaccharide export system permease protein